MTDDDAPWTIKSIAKLDSQAAVSAAKRQRLTVGEWVGMAIRRQIEAERAEAEPQMGEVIPPGGQGLTVMPHHAMGLSDLAVAVELVERITRLRPDGKPPRGFVRRIEQRLRAIV
jgi:hypothetical protein